MRRAKIGVFIFGFIACLLACNCESEKPTHDTSCDRGPDEVVFKFVFMGDHDTLFFNASTSNQEVIQEAQEELNRPLKERIKHINGLLDSGECATNPGYDWHFVPGEWFLAEASIEWCDAFPANPDSTGIERVCPWSSRLYSLVE